MDNAILYAGIEELNTIKEYVLELKSYEEKNTELEQEEVRLEKVISEKKKESDWIREFRLESYKNFCNIDMPSFGPNINLNFDDVIYYKSNFNWSKIAFLNEA